MAFQKRKIYLAGPITGWTYNDARYGWRKEFADLLAHRGADHIECYSPMREKEFLEKDQCIGGEADYESLHGFGTPHGILTRDHNDVRNCDAMVACFLGATKASIGTCVEFGFAWSYRKPIIMVMEPERRIVTETRMTTVDLSMSEVIRRGGEPGMAPYGAVGHEYKGADVDGVEIEGIVKHAEANRTTGGYTFAVEVPTKTEIVKNPHDHVFLRACAGYCVPTLEHAADICQSLLTPGL